MLVAATLRTGEPATDPALLGEIAGDPATLSLRPGPLSAARVGGAGARAARRRRRRGVLRRLPRGHRRQPAAAAPAAARARGRGRRARTPAGRRSCARSARGRRRAPCCCGSRGCPPTRAAVARAVAVLGEGAELPAVAALAGLDERGGRGRDAAARPRRDPAPRPAARLRAPARARRRLPRAAAGRARARSTSAPRACCATRGAGDRAGRRAAAASRRGAATPGSPSCSSGRRDARCARAPPTAPSPTSRRALEEPPPAERADRRAARARPRGGADRAARRRPSTSGGLRRARRPGRARRASPTRSRARCCSPAAPREAPRSPRAAAAELPPEHEDLRALLEALELATLYFGGGRPELLDARWPRHAHRRPSRAPGAQALAAMPRYDWAHRGGTADECCRARPRGARRRRADRARQRAVLDPPIDVLVLADRDEALDVARRAARQAHRHGSLFSVASRAPVARLHAAVARRPRGRGRAAPRGARRVRHLGLRRRPRSLLRRASSCAGAASSAATSPARGARSSAEPPRRRRSDGARYWLHAQLALLVAEGRWEEALAAARRVRDALRRRTATRPRRLALAAAPRRSSGSGAHDGGARARRRGARARARTGARPARSAARCACSARSSASAGLAHLEEAVARARAARTARLEHAKALAALGAALRHARRPAEAREPLRRALELAVACDAPGAGRATSAPSSTPTGARPRTDALAGVAALTASERRVVDLAAGGRDQPRHRPGAVRDAQDGRGPPLQRLPQARRPLAPRAARALSARSPTNPLGPKMGVGVLGVPRWQGARQRGCCDPWNTESINLALELRVADDALTGRVTAADGTTPTSPAGSDWSRRSRRCSPRPGAEAPA